MALPAQYSLMESEYNEFLEALIGESASGMPISVISAFARFDMDPWKEAERLSDLSREGAVTALGGFIDRVPDGAWKQADTAAIATRLTALLPKHRPTLRFSRRRGERNGVLEAAAARSAGPHEAGPAPGARDRSGSSETGTDRADGDRIQPSSRGGGGRRRMNGVMAAALLVLLVTIIAAWFDATVNRDHSLVQENRDTTRLP